MKLLIDTAENLTSLNSATCCVLNIENTLLPDRFTAFLEPLVLWCKEDLEGAAAAGSGSGVGGSSFSSFFTFFFLTFSLSAWN